MDFAQTMEYSADFWTSTGTVIAAMITGVLTIIGVVFKSTRDSKLNHITGERTTWREKIREIAREISTLDFSNTSNENQTKLTESLTTLKVRLNSFSNNEKDISKKRYLKDTHIWKSISILESNDSDKNAKEKEKNRLISYLSLLLKFDWERSKIESSVNMISILGYSLYVISNALLAYFAYSYFQDTELSILLKLILLFATIFFIPPVLIFIGDNFNNNKNPILLFLYYGIPISYLALLLYICKITPDSNMGPMDLPIFLIIISLILLALSKYKLYKNASNYYNAVKQIDSMDSNEAEKRDKAVLKRNERLQKNEKTKKQEIHYHPFDCLRLLIILIRKVNRLAYVFISIYILLPIKRKETEAIRFLDSKINKIKNTIKK